MPQKVDHQPGIDRSGARAHRDAVERSKSHGGIHGPASSDRRQGTSSTQVTNDLAKALVTLASDNIRYSSLSVPETGPVKTVSYQSLFYPLERPCIGPGGFR